MQLHCSPRIMLFMNCPEDRGKRLLLWYAYGNFHGWHIHQQSCVNLISHKIIYCNSSFTKFHLSLSL